VTRYELLDRIGVGGMAEIFRGKAVAAGGFEKPVAIKRILPHLSQDRRFVELLIAEAKVLSLLKHRNIVQIFDVGLGDDGKYFLVMEYVDGKDIGAVQRSLESLRRRVPYDLVLHIGAEICEALDHAHNSRGPDGRPMGLVHRDVSPSNVLLSRAGEVKLTDFGIAKRAEQDVTGAGAVRGKFAYISPEQARNEHLDPRSDVFSVGILLWELFTNRRLFSGLGDLEALRGVREAQITPPSQTDPRLRREIDAIVMTALARDKNRRFASAGELGAQLRALRYALDVTVGDPALELARIVEATVETERENKPIPPSGPRDFDPNEATVIRIRTADAFSANDNDASIVAAREVIDRFEDEETRLAQLSGDQLRFLRDAAPIEAATPPRPKRTPGDDEATRARSPLRADEIEALAPAHDAGAPNEHFTASDETKLVVSRDRRTPPPQHIVPSAPAAPPPLTLDVIEPPLTLDEPASVSQSVSKSLSQSVSHSVSNAPLTLEQTPQGPPPPMKVPTQGQPGWGPPVAAQRLPPVAQANFARPPTYPARPSTPPPVAGAQTRSGTGASLGFKPWMLVVGAVIVALLAFAITRAFIR
jgi:eukaryotic-like serine/threonine-protein kinase